MTTYLTKRDLAAKLQCSVSKIEKAMRQGELHFTKIGTLTRFTEADVERFIAGTTQSLEPIPALSPSPKLNDLRVSTGGSGSINVIYCPIDTALSTNRISASRTQSRNLKGLHV